MITTLPPSTRPQNRAQTALGADYRLLGLRPREARVEVIRQAVHQAASQVQLDSAAQMLEQVETPVLEPVTEEQRLTDIAVAGYRLLDPRRRKTLFERVQLLMWTEDELDTTLTSLWSRQPEAPPKLKIALKSKKAIRNQASSTVADEDENQVALELFRNLRSRDRKALALWIGLASLTASLAATLAIFAYFGS